MAKKQEQELEELKEQDSDVEEVEEEATSKGTPSNDFKNIVITECNRIIDQYIEICKSNNDEAFLKALDNPDKTKENCVNHIMNNLTKKRIYGGADSLMYEFIHEYYVDNFTEVKDNWSNFMRNPSAISNNSPKAAKPTMKDIEEGYQALSNEDKNRIYLEQLHKAEEEARKKALEKIKADEAKRKEKEKELAAKKKAEEARKKAEIEAKKEVEKNSGGFSQMSLFDL